jgi:exodeoxyribonuclease-3
LHPDTKDIYTWWSFRTAARKRNVGWRIDYFFISDELKPFLNSAEIHNDIEGSDHCPVSIEINPN